MSHRRIARGERRPGRTHPVVVRRLARLRAGWWIDWAISALLLSIATLLIAAGAHAEPAAEPSTEPSPAPVTAPAATEVPASTVPVSTVPVTTVRVATAPAPPATAAVAPRPAPAPPVPPSDLHDLDAWLSYRSRSHVPMLPSAARGFYRRGLIAWKSGQDADGVRAMRGAAALDPTFAAPHVSLAMWYLTREPSESLQQWGAVVALIRRDFPLQLDIAGNCLFTLLHTLLYGLLATSMVMLLARQRELRHMGRERFARAVSPASAAAWSCLAIVLPFLWGFGLTLPTLACLGLLWPTLRARERALTVMLAVVAAIAPFGSFVFGRLTLPLQADRAPYYGVPMIENEPWSSARQQEFARLAGREPRNPFVAFGQAWTARRGQDLATAESAYRRVLEIWPADARALNNLGNILSTEGQFDPAIALYDRAIAADPQDAAPYFNKSQIYTRLFDYRRASDALSRASALDFELVQTYQAQSQDGSLPLADRWMHPRSFWRALASPEASRQARPVLPPLWRRTIETSTPWFTLAVVLMLGGAIAIGLAWQRTLPLRYCSNCGAVVCRRCASRRREVALCPPCAGAEARAESPDFARVLLSQRRRRVERIERSLQTATAALIPGYGILVFRHVWSAMFLLMPTTLLVSRALGVRGPFGSEFEFAIDGPGVSTLLLLAPWVVVWAVSLIAYVGRRARLDAQNATTLVRSRVSTTTHLTEAA